MAREGKVAEEEVSLELLSFTSACDCDVPECMIGMTCSFICHGGTHSHNMHDNESRTLKCSVHDFPHPLVLMKHTYCIMYRTQQMSSCIGFQHSGVGLFFELINLE